MTVEISNIIENNKTIYMSESSLETLMDMERVLDQLDLYAFKNWRRGELIEGPIREDYWVEASFMWPYKLMPDPDGAKRLLEYRVKVEYGNDTLTTPVKVESPNDYRPGTKKPKLKEDKVWVVKMRMPVEMIEDIKEGFIELEGQDIDVQDLEDAYAQNLEDTTSMDAQVAATPGEEITNV